jgi:H+/Cl- antiporter ClcA
MKKIVKVGVVSALCDGGCYRFVLHFGNKQLQFNLLDTLIFCSFGIVSGLIGIGFVKLHKIRLKTM